MVIWRLGSAVYVVEQASKPKAAVASLCRGIYCGDSVVVYAVEPASQGSRMIPIVEADDAWGLVVSV